MKNHKRYRIDGVDAYLRRPAIDPFPDKNSHGDSDTDDWVAYMVAAWTALVATGVVMSLTL